MADQILQENFDEHHSAINAIVSAPEVTVQELLPEGTVAALPEGAAMRLDSDLQQMAAGVKGVAERIGKIAMKVEEQSYTADGLVRSNDSLKDQLGMLRTESSEARRQLEEREAAVEAEAAAAAAAARAECSEEICCLQDKLAAEDRLRRGLHNVIQQLKVKNPTVHPCLSFLVDFSRLTWESCHVASGRATFESASECGHCSETK